MLIYKGKTFVGALGNSLQSCTKADVWVSSFTLVAYPGTTYRVLFPTLSHYQLSKCKSCGCMRLKLTISCYNLATKTHTLIPDKLEREITT